MYLDIDRFNMIDGFAIDTMHCLYQNVVRRFLKFLKGGKIARMPVTSSDAEATIKGNYITGPEWYKIGDAFAKLKLPSEFHRSPRSFRFFDKWKATEFRMFLLYGGDICLLKLARETHLRSFRALVCAIRILSHETLSTDDVS